MACVKALYRACQSQSLPSIRGAWNFLNVSFVSPTPTSLRHPPSLRVECYLCCVDSKGCCSCSGGATCFGPPDFFCLYFTTEYQIPPNELITRPVTFRAWNLTPPSTKKPKTWTSTEDEMERGRGRGRGRVTDVKEGKSNALEHHGMHGDAAAVRQHALKQSPVCRVCKYSTVVGST